MPRFRKQPVEIEAHQILDPHELPEHHAAFIGIAEWCGGKIVHDAVDGAVILIDTLEGQMKALPGDWIIKGVNGEFYPCKPDIFEKTYERV
ncbi:MAG: hypothetical protein AAGD43_04680 [Pseudomonadota bacterium]